MPTTTPELDDTAEDGVVRHFDKARARLKGAAAKAQERLAPTLEKTSEAGRNAVATARRNPWAVGLVAAGIGIGAFLLIRSSARTRVIGAAGELLRSQRGRIDDLTDRFDLRDLVSRVDLRELASRIDLKGLAERLDLDGLAQTVKGEVRRRADRLDLEGIARSVKGELRRRAA